MIGDRYLTDVVFGNRNGMMTIRPQPFTSVGEPRAVRLVSGRGQAAHARLAVSLRSCSFNRVGCVEDIFLFHLHSVSMQARMVEEGFVARWQNAGVQPPPHPLLEQQPDAAAREAAFLLVQPAAAAAAAAAAEDPI